MGASFSVYVYSCLFIISIARCSDQSKQGATATSADDDHYLPFHRLWQVYTAAAISPQSRLLPCGVHAAAPHFCHLSLSEVLSFIGPRSADLHIYP